MRSHTLGLGDGLVDTKVICKQHRFRVPFDLRGIYCVRCGYNLTGNVTGTCPECGHGVETAVESATKS